MFTAAKRWNWLVTNFESNFELTHVVVKQIGTNNGVMQYLKDCHRIKVVNLECAQNGVLETKVRYA